ncbi:MAG: hypothetical protein RL308_2499, partial [Bacteroidota bacterium]
VHQYIAQEAYYYLETIYLKYYCGDINDLKLIKDAIIDPRTNKVFHGSIDDRTNQPWLTNFGIAIGEWREDVDDPMYGYSLTNGGTASVAHFWDADNGNESLNDIGLGSSKPNAWHKASNYYTGGIPIYIQYTDYDWNTKNPIAGYTIRYTHLEYFYVFGKCEILNVHYANGAINVYKTPQKVTLIQSKTWALQILGRIAHLLQDMGVPAHSHNHAHPCPLEKPDEYENTMGGVWPNYGNFQNNFSELCELDPGGTYPANDWTYTDVPLYDIGEEIDDKLFGRDYIYSLFYTQNQLADYFPSGSKTGSQYVKIGDSDLPNLTCSSCNDYLKKQYSSISNGVPPSNINVNNIADINFKKAIENTAKLFLSFAVHTNMIPNFNVILDSKNFSSGKYISRPRLYLFNSKVENLNIVEFAATKAVKIKNCSLKFNSKTRIYINPCWRANRMSREKSCAEVKNIDFSEMIPRSDVLFKFNIYPNPANDYLTISPTSLLDNQNLIIQLYDNFGYVLLNTSWNSYNQDEPFKLDISTLKSGFFILKISNEHGERFIEKLIVN